jgi:hypothetical protein
MDAFKRDKLTKAVRTISSLPASLDINAMEPLENLVRNFQSSSPDVKQIGVDGNNSIMSDERQDYHTSNKIKQLEKYVCILYL